MYQLLPCLYNTRTWGKSGAVKSTPRISGTLSFFSAQFEIAFFCGLSGFWWIFDAGLT